MIQRSHIYDISNYAEKRALLDYMNSNKNNFYIYDTFSFDNNGYGIFETPKFNQFGNSSPSGDWFSNLKINIDVKKRNGIDNIFKALAEKNNVFYITALSPSNRRAGNDDLPGNEKANMICIFLKEHYNINVKPKEIDFFGKENIYGVYEFNPE